MSMLVFPRERHGIVVVVLSVGVVGEIEIDVAALLVERDAGVAQCSAVVFEYADVGNLNGSVGNLPYWIALCGVVEEVGSLCLRALVRLVVGVGRYAVVANVGC